MLRLKTAAMLIELVTIARINWLVAVSIIVGFAILDWLLQKEDEENIAEANAYIESVIEAERQRNRDFYFGNFMKDGELK